MKKILLINFKRIGDIISSLSAITMNDDTEYHMLCFKEFKKVPKSLNNKIHFHFIDRKKIEFLLKSPLINDALAIKEMHQATEELTQIDFDEIINFSNDKLASRLVSLFKNGGTVTRGIYYKENRIKHSGAWEILYNNVVPKSKIYPVNLKDIFGYMVGNPNNRDSSFLKFNPKNDDMVKTNYNAIKDKFSHYGIMPKIVGIAPFASTKTKSIGVEETIKLIDIFKNQRKHQVPVVIHAPIDSEREKVQEISAQFKGNLITIEADLLALNSVLKNLDALITADSATIHYANAVGVNSLMIAKGEAPLFLQGTAEPGDLVLTNITYSQKRATPKPIEAEEIFLASQLIIEPQRELDLANFNSRLYLVNADAFGVYYMQITNHIDYDLNEIKRDIQRNFIMKSFVGFTPKIHIPSKIIHDESTKALFEAEKLNIFAITKNVLTCLRLVRATSAEGQKQFVQTLESIISNSDDESSLSALPVTLFYNQINDIEAVDAQDSVKQFEKRLFELKNNLQVIFNLFKEYEAVMIAKKAKKSQISIRETGVTK